MGKGQKRSVPPGRPPARGAAVLQTEPRAGTEGRGRSKHGAQVPVLNLLEQQSPLGRGQPHVCLGARHEQSEPCMPAASAAWRTPVKRADPAVGHGWGQAWRARLGSR